MKCNHCGTEFEAKFCPECGARANFGSSQPEQQQVPQPAYQTGVKPKKKKKPIVIILLIIVAIIGVVTIFGNKGSNEPSQIIQDTQYPESTTEKYAVDNTVDVDGIDALESLIMTDAENIISELDAEYKKLLTSVSSYDEYIKNIEKVEAFYGKIISTSEKLSVKLCEHSITYAELLINSGNSYDDIYDELDGIYDCIYDDAGDVLYDGIYDGVLDDMYDDFYSGVIEDGMDSVEYSEWADVRSDAYDMWSDTRSDCYEIWSDMRSDVYEFWSDLRSDMFNDDLEDAKKTISKFKADIQKSSTDKSSSTEALTTKEPETTEAMTTPTTTEKEVDLVDGMRPEFKEAMDSYETFMTDYVDFMKKFEEDPSDLSILADYADYMKKYADFAEDFEAWDDEDMNNAEMAYYIDVQARVSKKLLEVSE